MRLLRRHVYVLLFFAVLTFSSVMVLRQVLLNESRNVERREDFILLQQQGHAKLAEHLYQVLIHSFRHRSDGALWGDVHRTALLVDAKVPQPESLIWKYHVSLNNELRRRAEQRLEQTLQRAGNK